MKKMKNVVLIFCFSFLTQIGFSQSFNHQDYLIEFLGQERFDRILASNPHYLSYLDVRCSEGFMIMDYVNEKMESMNIPVINEFIKKTKQNGKDIDGTCVDGYKKEVLTPEEFLQHALNGTLNILAFDFDYDKSKVIYYRIGNTGKLIAIYPAEYIAKKVSTPQ